MNSSRDHQIEALSRIISVLLQGMALHSFCHDETEFAHFQGSLRRLREQVQTVDDEDTALILAGSAIRSLEDHSAAVTRTIAAKQKEMEAALEMVSRSLLIVSQASAEDAVELQEGQKEVVSARTEADFAAARTRLGACLERVRLHVQRANEAVRMPPQSGAAGETDAVTALPNSRTAIDAIASVWNQRQRYSAALFGVQRLDTVNARFGFQAGDELLRVMTGHLAPYFENSRLLFRWHGPCLLGLIEKRPGDARVASDLQRLVSARLEHIILKNSRQITLPVSICWGILPLEASGIEEMIQKLDDFCLNRLYQER